MGFSIMLWGAEKLVPAEYWCPYGTNESLVQHVMILNARYIIMSEWFVNRQ